MNPVEYAFRCLFLSVFISVVVGSTTLETRCQRWKGRKQRKIWGDFLEDPSCRGPNGKVYPSEIIDKLVSQLPAHSTRTGRSLADPYDIQEKLLKAYKQANGLDGSSRQGKASTVNSCNNSPERLCPTEYNTTVPMYGISLTSGEPVTIVQKFPNLLQQVVFEECLTDECDVIHGKCIQTYVPQLFFVVPMGPVTLMGQDYILVESGCVCTPKSSNAIL